MSPRHVKTAEGEERIEETAVEARQGYRDRPVWFVLVVSTTLLAAIFAIIWLVFAEPEATPSSGEPPAATGTPDVPTE